MIKSICLALFLAASLLAQDPIRINSGYTSKAVQSLDGRTWDRDRHFESGGMLHVGTYSAENVGWLDKARVGLYGDFSYSIPIANGEHLLNLYFVELQGWTVGYRVFNVRLEGQLVLQNFDILAETDRFKKLVKTFPVTVTDGNLDISVEGVNKGGILSAIEIFPGAPGEEPEPEPEPEPDPTPVPDPTPDPEPDPEPEPEPDPTPDPTPEPDPVPPPTTSGNQFFVAPNGNGDGSIESPWSMATALAHPPAVKPGDTIWVRGGVYDGPYRSYLKGEPGKPVILRAYPGERATIDTANRLGSSAAIEVRGDDAWYWGLELMSSNPKRITGVHGSGGGGSLGLVDGITTFAKRLKFINLIIHDTRQGYGFWEDAIDSEIYGNLIYYNGWSGGDRGHGHGIYSANRTGLKHITDNIQFKGYAMGMRAYGSEQAAAVGYRWNGNISFESGYLHGGAENKWANFMVAVGSGARDIVVENTYTYMDPLTNDGYSWLGWSGSGRQFDIIARNNWWIGGEIAVNVALWDKITYTGNVHYTQLGRMIGLEMTSAQSTANYTWDNNSYFGRDRFAFKTQFQSFANWKTITGLDKNSTYSPNKPTGVKTFVRPNKYEEGRAHIVVYNFDEVATVLVDVSHVLEPGDLYEVRDAENFYGTPVLSGTYNGAALPLPMHLTTIAQPSGPARREPVHTRPDFNVFVLLKR